MGWACGAVQVELFLLPNRKLRNIPQQHRAIAAMRIMAIDARTSDRRHMLAQCRSFIVAGRANLLFGHREAHRHHVALCCSDVTHRARRLHRRVHRLPGQLIRVARRALRVFGHNSRVLNRPRRSRQQQESRQYPNSGLMTHRRVIVVIHLRPNHYSESTTRCNRMSRHHRCGPLAGSGGGGGVWSMLLRFSSGSPPALSLLTSSVFTSIF